MMGAACRLLSFARRGLADNPRTMVPQKAPTRAGVCRTPLPTHPIL